MAAPGTPITGGASNNAPLGYQQITPSAATGFTIPKGATVAVVVADTASIRWRDDGTNPTTAIGMSLPVGTYLAFTANLSAVKFISATGVLNVSYY